MRYMSLELKNHYILRLFPGEDIIESLQAFCKHIDSIKAGFIQGIGAVSAITIGYYDGSQYIKNSFQENFEIVSLIGNIVKDHNIHLHGIFSRENGICVGGHVFHGCIVSFTCEVLISVLEPELVRNLDPNTNLNLLSLPNELT